MGADAAAEEQFGPYLVYERLGVGGMATVHRALERGIEGFERIVALKRLLPHLAADATFIKAFVREAKLASYLKHVNIVQLFELGRVGSAYFISMEYIDGRDIRRILRQARTVSGPPPIHVTVGLLMQLCDALDYAHHKVDDSGQPLGLVHRDVSPSNLLVTTTGQLKVIDFGIAKAAAAQLRTQTGRVKGKLAYMAPEALSGKELDARSDLFAAGVIAHELLTARPLFASKNEYQTLMKVQRAEVVPPSTFNQGCPPELDAIVLRALARDPDHRFVDASALRQALHALRKQYSLPTTERDIVTWIDWAFSLEAPAGGFVPNQELDPSGLFDVRSGRPRHARPTRNDEDILDVAWSEGDDMSNGQPVLLPDVPDLSEAHMSSALGADVRLDLVDLDDLADDLPTPLPSHGAPRPVPVTSPVRATHPGPVPAVPGASDRSRPIAPQQGFPRATDRGSPASDPSPNPQGFARATESRVPSPGSDPLPAVTSPGFPRATESRVPSPASDPLPSVASAKTGAAASSAAASAGVRSVMIPPRVRTITSPPRMMPAASIAPRPQPAPDAAPPRAEAVGTLARNAVPIPAPSRAVSSKLASPAVSRGGESIVTGSRDAPPSWTPPTAYAPVSPTADTADPDTPVPWPSPRGLPSASTPPRTRRPTAAGAGAPSPRPETTTADSALAFSPGEVTPRGDTIADPIADPITDLMAISAADDLGLAADTIPSMPAIPASAVSGTSPTEPIVHFRKVTRTLPPPAAPPSPARPATEPPRPFVAATDLFARPEAEVEAEIEADAASTTAPGVPDPPSTAIEPSPPILAGAAPSASLLIRTRDALRRAPRRRLLVIAAIAVTVAIAAAVATLVILRYTAPVRGAVVENTQPPVSTGTAVSTLRFVLIPADSEITIAGKPIHVGSPWEIDLEPGVHQIEIHRDGYKGVLTSIHLAAGEIHPVQIELEKLSAAVTLDAMPAVEPAPAIPTVPDVAPAPPSRPAPRSAAPPPAPEPASAVDKRSEGSPDRPSNATAGAGDEPAAAPDQPEAAGSGPSDSKPAIDESPATPATPTKK